MPFKVKTFQENIEQWVDPTARDELVQACKIYSTLTTPQQKVHCIQRMMEVMDQGVDEETRRVIMEACGRGCLGASTLSKARRLQQGSQDLDDLLNKLNEAHIGGGHLKRVGNIIHAAYDRCYCGSVSHVKEPFSATYCCCSCGWYRQLFEILLECPVEVDLLGSIIQGDKRCQFQIRFQESG